MHRHPLLSRSRPARCAAVLAAVLGLAGCGESRREAPPPAPPDRSIPVVAESVSLETLRERLQAVGTARALRSVDLHPEAAGQVEALRIEAGDRVDAEAVLLELDSRDQKLALELAELRLTDARRLLDRYERANARGETLPETTLDNARTALETARIERDRARVTLADRFVRAPFAGVVGLTDVDIGDRIDPATVITTLDDRSALLVAFEVPEAFVDRVVPGTPVTLRPWSGDDTTTGQVIDLNSRIDPETRTVRVRARVPNGADRLRPGMSFRVELALEGRAWPVIPEVALQWGGDGPYLWAVREGRAARVPARIVQRQSGRILVDAPLTAGERVVAEGVQRMREGLAVRALEAEALAQDARAVLGGKGAEEGAEG